MCTNKNNFAARDTRTSFSRTQTKFFVGVTEIPDNQLQEIPDFEYHALFPNLEDGFTRKSGAKRVEVPSMAKRTDEDIRREVTVFADFWTKKKGWTPEQVAAYIKEKMASPRVAVQRFLVTRSSPPQAVSRVIKWQQTEKPTICGPKCRNARGPSCDCICEGKFHGAGVGSFARAHNISLPSTKRKLNIDEATSALSSMGYRMGNVRHSLADKTSYWSVTTPTGSVVEVAANKLTDFVYGKIKDLNMTHTGAKAKFSMPTMSDLKIKAGRNEDEKTFTATVNGNPIQGVLNKGWSRLGGWGWEAKIAGVPTTGGSQMFSSMRRAVEQAVSRMQFARNGAKAKFGSDTISVNMNAKRYLTILNRVKPDEGQEQFLARVKSRLQKVVNDTGEMIRNPDLESELGGWKSSELSEILSELAGSSSGLRQTLRLWLGNFSRVGTKAKFDRRVELDKWTSPKGTRYIAGFYTDSRGISFQPFVTATYSDGGDQLMSRSAPWFKSEKGARKWLANFMERMYSRTGTFSRVGAKSTNAVNPFDLPAKPEDWNGKTITLNGKQIKVERTTGDDYDLFDLSSGKRVKSVVKAQLDDAWRHGKIRDIFSRTGKTSMAQSDFKVGDQVHLGFAQKGGTGFDGIITKIEGTTVYIKSPEEGRYGARTWKGPLSSLTHGWSGYHADQHSRVGAKSAFAMIPKSEVMTLHKQRVAWLKQHAGQSNQLKLAEIYLEAGQGDLTQAVHQKAITKSEWTNLMHELETAFMRVEHGANAVTSINKYSRVGSKVKFCQPNTVSVRETSRGVYEIIYCDANGKLQSHSLQASKENAIARAKDFARMMGMQFVAGRTGSKANMNKLTNHLQKISASLGFKPSSITVEDGVAKINFSQRDGSSGRLGVSLRKPLLDAGVTSDAITATADQVCVNFAKGAKAKFSNPFEKALENINSYALSIRETDPRDYEILVGIVFGIYQEDNAKINRMPSLSQGAQSRLFKELSAVRHYQKQFLSSRTGAKAAFGMEVGDTVRVKQGGKTVSGKIIKLPDATDLESGKYLVELPNQLYNDGRVTRELVPANRILMSRVGSKAKFSVEQEISNAEDKMYDGDDDAPIMISELVRRVNRKEITGELANRVRKLVKEARAYDMYSRTGVKAAFAKRFRSDEYGGSYARKGDIVMTDDGECWRITSVDSRIRQGNGSNYIVVDAVPSDEEPTNETNSLKPFSRSGSKAKFAHANQQIADGVSQLLSVLGFTAMAEEAKTTTDANTLKRYINVARRRVKGSDQSDRFNTLADKLEQMLMSRTGAKAAFGIQDRKN